MLSSSSDVKRRQHSRHGLVVIAISGSRQVSVILKYTPPFCLKGVELIVSIYTPVATHSTADPIICSMVMIRSEAANKGPSQSI